MKNRPHNLRVFAQLDRASDPFGSGLFLILVDRASPHGEGGLRGSAVCTDVTFQKLDEGTVPPESARLPLSEDAAQALMENLWHAGVRPREAMGSIGQLGATQRHLDDLRTLLFHKAGIPKLP